MTSTVYDRLWHSAWGDLQRLGPVHRHAKERLLETVGALEIATILDVGCGSGLNLEALASLRKFELSGVDVSGEALSMARIRAPGAHLQVLDIEREVFSQTFDLVVSIQVIEHIVDDMAALRNMCSMVGRYLLVATMQGRMRPSELRIGHIRNYSAVELRRKIEVCGLEVIRVEGWGFPFYSPLYRSITEWLPGGPPTGPMGRGTKLIASMLYYLYKFNWAGRGDVITVLAKRP